MNHKLLISIALFGGATQIFAASTCETRVDKHQKATTLERVEYCLNEEANLPNDDKYSLVYYGVSDKTPAKQTKQQNEKFRQSYFDDKKWDVSRDYVGTKKFPELVNDIPAGIPQAQENDELLDDSFGQTTILSANTTTEKHLTDEEIKKLSSENQPKRVVPSSANETVITKEGLKVRQTKPKRYMKETVQSKNTIPTPDVSANSNQDVELPPVLSNDFDYDDSDPLNSVGNNYN